MQSRVGTFSSKVISLFKYDATMDSSGEPYKPGELPRPLTITIIGETALDHLHEVARQIEENIQQTLADDSKEN